MSNHEILFRGKREDNGEWVEGFAYEHEPSLTCFAEDKKEDSKWYIAKTAFADWNMPRNVSFARVDFKTVGQSTCVKDNTGNRLYEDDILRFTMYGHTYTGVVTYKKGAFRVVCTHPLQYSFCMASSVSLEEAVRYGAVVIGNIHDNPELLEEEKA